MKKIFTLSIFSLFISAQTFAGPWTQKQSLEGPGRHRAFSMTIGNRGYVGGGWNGNTMYYDAWEYDPSNNSWTQKANIPTTMWSDPAFGIGTKGYVVEGGYTYMFNPLNNTWTIVNFSSPSATYYDQLKFVINGKGYIASGADIYEFNPTTNTWLFKLTLPTYFGDMAFAIGNKGYFVDTYYNLMYAWDPVTNVYSYKAICPGTMSQGASWSVNGKGYVGCGQVPPNYTDEKYCFEYDPIANTWRGINDFDGSGRENLTAFTIGSKSYLTCGTSGINMNDLWEFNSANITGINELDLSSSVTIYPNPSIDGKFFVKASSSDLSSLQIFDVNGRSIKTIQVHEEGMIDMQEMANGEYFVVLFNTENKKCGTKKIILVQ